MATPSSPPLPSGPPSLARIASVIHAATDDDPVARIAHVHLDPETESLDLGFWDIPPGPATRSSRWSASSHRTRGMPWG